MEFIDIAKSFLQAVTAQLDPYTSDKGIIEANDDASVSLFTPSHIQFAVYGRGPGKKPPLDPLIEWITKKGIVSGVKEIRGTAFAIQASIGQKGTLNWVQGAPDALDEAIDDNLKRYFEQVNILLVERQTQELQQVWKQQFPKTSEFNI